MTTQAAQWGERDLHQRFDLGPPRDELTALAATLDGLLGRLDAALRHEQRFSAEVAHELRTPLSGLRGEAELALRGDRSDAELRYALERVLAGTDRMAAVIDTLLAAARNDATGPPGSSDAAAAIRGLAGPDIEVVAPAGVVTVGADQSLVTAALQPLVENAVRHAKRDVRVELHRAGAEVVIAVTDDGPGVAPEDAERIFAPGYSETGERRARARTLTPARPRRRWRRPRRRLRLRLRAAAPEHRPALSALRSSSQADGPADQRQTRFLVEIEQLLTRSVVDPAMFC